VGLFPLQYYNRPEMKKSPPNGLERSWMDIGTEAFRQQIAGRDEIPSNEQAARG